jgi:DNA-binding SARP family transcriptional activator/tetratricopeptide (TPR) repeat protein
VSGLVLRLLGEPALAFDGKHLKLPPARCISLLALLAVRREPLTRASLAAQISPDDLDVDARANLRRRLHLLQQSLPASGATPWVLATSTHLAWNGAAPAWIDSRTFEDAISDSRRRAEGIELYRGDLLAGFFDECLLADRERLRTLYVDACFAEALALRRDSRPRDAVGYADRILAIDEWREDALRLAMTLRYECGDRSSALSQFERFAKRLMAEMAVAPMPETLALRDAILANAAAAPEPGQVLGDDVTTRPPAGMPFVGRQRELATLDAAWRHAARGRGTLLFVSGEAGIGKSRLAGEFAAGVAAQRGRALFGETSNPQAYPYEPIVDALRRGLPLVAESSVEPLWLGVLAEVLPELRGAFPDLPVPEPLDTEKARARLFEAMARTIERLAKARPLVLVLEDVHWADPATLGALEALTRRLYSAPVLVVAVYRSSEVTPGHPLAALRRRLQAQRSATTLELHALQPADVDDLLEKAAHVDGNAALSASIYARSEGNPLFAGMLLRNYLENGTLTGDDVPGSLTDTILARAGALDAASRMLVETASVAGRSFRTDLLAAVLGWREGEVLDALGTVLDRGLVRTSESSGLTFAFTHALIEKAIYETISPPERTLRHRRVAAVLDQMHGEGAQALASIARHWELGGEKERAGRAYLLAAKAAASVYASDETIALARAALGTPLDDAQRFEALNLVVSTEARRVAAQQWKADLDELVAAAAHLDGQRRFVAADAYAQYHSNVGDRVAQRASIEGMLEAAELLSPQHRGAALYQSGLLEFQEGRLAEALSALDSALTMLRGCDDVTEARCRFTTVQVLQRLARFADVQRHVDAMRALYEKRPLPLLRFYFLHAEQQVASDMVDAIRLRDVGSEMLELALAMGDLYGEVHARYALGIGAFRLGSWHEIRDQFERGVALCERIGSAAMGSSLDNAMATCELYFGLIPQALARLDRLFPALEEANAQLPMWVSQHARSEAYALLGDAPRALEYAKQALRIAESSGGTHHKTASLLVLGSALCLAGDPDEGLTLMDRAVATRRELATPLRLVEALGVYLEALLRAGRVARAGEIAQELTALYEANADTAWRPALLLSSIGRALTADGDTAGGTAYLDRAREELERDAARLEDEAVAAAYRALPYYSALVATGTETDLRAPEPA